jgi:hypothetical protein
MWVNKFSSVLIAFIFILTILTLSFPRPSLAIARSRNPKASKHYLVNRKNDISNILSVLEKKTGDQELVEKVKDKLSKLSGGKMKLISSLCERISHDSQSAGADIAFLLIITLIIFS